MYVHILSRERVLTATASPSIDRWVDYKINEDSASCMGSSFLYSLLNSSLSLSAAHVPFIFIIFPLSFPPSLLPSLPPSLPPSLRIPLSAAHVQSSELLKTMDDVITGLYAINRLKGDYALGVEPYFSNFTELIKYEKIIKSKNLIASKCNMISNIFKPLYCSKYFSIARKFRNPKIILALEMLQRSCVLLIVLCSNALGEER